MIHSILTMVLQIFRVFFALCNFFEEFEQVGVSASLALGFCLLEDFLSPFLFQSLRLVCSYFVFSACD